MKAIFFDIDGTLVSKTNPIISEELIDAFNILRKKGILLFIATGRHVLEIAELKISTMYDFDGYITLNGAYCYNKDTVFHKECITKEDAKIIHQYFKEHNISSLYVELDDLYCNKIDEYLILAQEEIHSPLPKVKEITNIDDHELYLFCPYMKKGIEDMIALTKDCKYTQWFELGYDVVAKSCGKDVGIKKVIEHFGIDIKDTMAFGDSMNDIEMLSIVNTSVAMGNSIDAVKEICDYVSDDVDKRGIIKALHHFDLL